MPEPLDPGWGENDICGMDGAWVACCAAGFCGGEGVEAVFVEGYAGEVLACGRVGQLHGQYRKP